jgi:uncharacterized protein involved in cysteine biosynthesis
MVRFDICSSYVRPQMQYYVEPPLRYALQSAEQSINHDIITNMENTANVVINTSNKFVDILEDGVHDIIKVVNDILIMFRSLLIILSHASLDDLTFSNIIGIIYNLILASIPPQYIFIVAILSVIIVSLILAAIAGYLLSTVNTSIAISSAIYNL